ncbi:MAG TPA: DUF4214 domain-containing protein, partial [Verrucomicrobiae bacterium]|nr:DUF4214 domain-containing protein [Verrucomicrobiae bacterium]
MSNVTINSVVLEDGVATLTGNIGVSDNNSLTLAINWGDGPVVQLLSLPGGATNFSTTHQYLDNHQNGVPSTPFIVTLTLTDNSGANNTNFLSAIFQDLLGRPVDPSGQSFYLSYLSGGGTRTQVATNLLGTSEYRTRLVRDDFQKFLHRAADPSGLSYGLNYLGSGTDEQYISVLAGSPEYFANRGGGNNSGFLDALFYDLLNRPVDTSSRNFYLGQMGSGATPAQIASEVLASAEYRTDLIGAFFWRFLHRAVDNSSLNFYLNLMNSGGTDEQVIASIAGSSEYFSNRSGGTATARASLVVSNLPPVLSALAITSPIMEGKSAILSGKLPSEDNGDTATLLVDWGDGSPPQTFAPGATNFFSLTHQYLNPNRAYSVSVGAYESNDPGTNYQTLSVQVLSPPSTVTSISLPKGLTHIVGQGAPSHVYTIQGSTNLVDWTYLGGATADN